MAGSADFTTPMGRFTLVQGEKRDFTLLKDGRAVGAITHMLSPVKEMQLSLPGGEGKLEAFGAVAFSLAYLMLHDDDVMVV